VGAPTRADRRHAFRAALEALSAIARVGASDREAPRRAWSPQIVDVPFRHAVTLSLPAGRIRIPPAASGSVPAETVCLGLGTGICGFSQVIAPQR